MSKAKKARTIGGALFILIALAVYMLAQSSGGNRTIGGTSGVGVPQQIGVARQVAQSAAITGTTLFTVGAGTSQYLVLGSVYCTTATATATANLTISYTDPSNTAQTVTTPNAACTTLGASSFAVVNTVIAAKNATTINYSTAVANAPTYDVRVQLFQVSAN